MRAIGSWLAALMLASAASAQIRGDGSTTSGVARDYPGPFSAIPAADGVRLGNNLLHSFAQFDVPLGGRATFTGDGSDVDYLIARVTGNDPSEILGQVVSTVGEAHFIFANPAGVLFGPESSVDVPGSFHVTTADRLDFGPGESLPTGLPTPIAPIVDYGAPSAFGFLSDDPALIGVEGFLELGRGQRLQLVGGDLRVGGPASQLFTPGGEIQLVALDSPGTVAGVASGEPLPAGFTRLGEVSIVDTAIVSVDGLAREPEGGAPPLPSRLVIFEDIPCDCVAIYADEVPLDEVRPDDVVLADDGNVALLIRPSSRPAGEILVRAGSLDLIDADVSATSFGAQGGRIDVELTGDLRIEKTTPSQENVGILARSATRVVPYSEDGVVKFFPATSQFVPVTDGSVTVGTRSQGGDVAIRAASVEIEGGATITATSTTEGWGGSIDLRVDESVRIAGRGSDGGASAIFANSQGSGPGGSIEIDASEVRLEGGGGIFAQTRGDGDAGDIALSVDRLAILDDSQIDSSTSAQSLGGAAGRTQGNGGDIAIEARESVLLAGRTDSESFARISTFSAEQSEGRAGSIRVSTPRLDLQDGAGISVTTRGAGAGGDVSLDVGELALRNGASISARSEAEPAPDLVPGNAGDIEIGPAGGHHPTRNVELFGGSAVATEATAASGGSIRITAPGGRIVHLVGSEITTSVTGGVGNGGNVTLEAPLVILNGSRIVARADAGAGGTILVRAPRAFVPSADSVVDASAGPAGIDGEVVIESPTVVLASSLAQLPESFLASDDLLGERCAARESGGPAGAFWVSRGSLRPTPDTYLASPESGYGGVGGLRNAGKTGKTCG